MPRLQIITALRSLTIEAAQQHKMRGQQLNERTTGGEFKRFKKKENSTRPQISVY